MASMSRTTSASSVQGFSVYQPSLGAPLQFFPAVGTKELEQLIDAYLPGPAAASEKRASISMDFFDHSNQTGENFKYYAVYSPIATPESSYAASFSNVSPVMSDLSFYSSPSQAPTPAAAPAAKKARVASRKPATKQERSDFANLPGMKILTKDGQDVTNAVSRGCKSKEQRDHAHLMRILKACDACKRKKIRCDPSHKKRSASQLEPEPKAEAAKPVKKTKTASKSTPESIAIKPSPAGCSFHMDDLGLSSDFSAPLDESWEQYLTFNDESATTSIPQDFYGAIPTDFDFFFGVENNFPPSASGSSGSSGSPIQPMTPSNSGLAPSFDDFSMINDGSLAFLQSEDSSQGLALPYLNPSGQHGSSYLDFNLFSPASSFVDEEPQLLKSGGKRSISASRTQRTDSTNASVSSARLSGDHDSYFDDHARSTLNPGEPEWQVPGGRVSPVRHMAACNSELGFHGSSLPFHANDAGHNAIHSVNAVMRLQVLHSTCSNSPVATTSCELGGTSLSSSSTTPLLSRSARSASPQAIHQDAGVLGGTGNTHVSSQTELQVLESGRRRPARPTTNTGLPLAVVPTAVVASASTGSPREQCLPAGGLQGLSNPLAVETPSQTAVAANGLSRAAEVLSSRTASLLSGQHHSPGSGNVNAALPVHGLSLSSSHGQLCHAAHLSTRILEMILAGGALLHNTPPVRQLLRNPAVLSWLVAFGLVSMLTVVAMSILPTQTQTQTQTTILTNLPSISMVLLSLLSVVSTHQHHRENPSGGAFDSLRSKSSHGRTSSTYRRSIPYWARSVVARAPLVSCI